MILKDITLNTPEENIIYDDVLLHLAEHNKGGEVLRFWESQDTFVVLGKISNEQEDVKIDKVCQDQIPLLRRSSGGGTVLQGQGCLNYSLILSKENSPQISDLRKSYQFILNKVIGALMVLGVNAVFCPISDIALADNFKKISGNAQKRSKKYILHHGTILYDFDLKKIDQYLKIPKDMPEYRRGRSHSEFVTNVPLAIDDVKNVIKKSFGIDYQAHDLNDFEKDCLKTFLDTRKNSINLSSV